MASEQGELFSSEILKGGPGAALKVLHDRARICQKCKLHQTRTNVVFGVGCSENPPIAFVGEGPGENEDLQAEPFVGRAGELLNGMLKAIGFDRSQIYICNVVNCRPPSNRRPEPDEIVACKEFLIGQLRIVRPKLIVTLGATAAQALLKSTKSIGDMRGRWFTWEETPVRCTYHPAYLIREPRKKRDAWSDLQFAMQRLQTISMEQGQGDGHGRSEATTSDSRGDDHDGRAAPLPEGAGTGSTPDLEPVRGEVRPAADPHEDGS